MTLGPARKLREKLLILLIIAALFIIGYCGPSVEVLFGEVGVKVLIWALGIVILAFVIIKDIAKMRGGRRGLGHGRHSSGNVGRHSSAHGYSVDELEKMDMMDEDD